MKICPKCGSEIEGLFCPECGYKVQDAISQLTNDNPIDGQQEHQEKTEKKEKTEKTRFIKAGFSRMGEYVKSYFDKSEKGAIIARVVIGGILIDCLVFCIYSNVVMKNKNSKSSLNTNIINNELADSKNNYDSQGIIANESDSETDQVENNSQYSLKDYLKEQANETLAGYNDETIGNTPTTVENNVSFNYNYYPKQQEYYGIWTYENKSKYLEVVIVSPIQNGSHLSIEMVRGNTTGDYSKEKYHLYGEYNPSNGSIQYNDGFAEFVNSNGDVVDQSVENYSGLLKCDGSNMILNANKGIEEHLLVKDSTLDINSPDEYILPLSSEGAIPEFILRKLTKTELRLARNEILARYGRLFQSEDLISYFNSKSWYKGSIDGEAFDANMDSRINTIEQYNLNMLKSYETR